MREQVHSHQYDLIFQSFKNGSKTSSEIIFIINSIHLPEIRERIKIVTKRSTQYENKYFGNKVTFFSPPNPDIFGNIEFGYGNCGHCTHKYGHNIWFHIELDTNSRALYCAQTISLLLHILSIPFEHQTSTQTQQLELRTRADSSHIYGHAVGGSLSESVIIWLRDYANKELERGSDTGINSMYVDMFPSVINAMKAACCSLFGSNNNWTERCGGHISSQGAFELSCLGDACDLSVYPDSIERGHDKYVDLECHNLDTAQQQLVLLAGLIELCELARISS